MSIHFKGKARDDLAIAVICKCGFRSGATLDFDFRQVENSAHQLLEFADILDIEPMPRAVKKRVDDIRAVVGDESLSVVLGAVKTEAQRLAHILDHGIYRLEVVESSGLVLNETRDGQILKLTYAVVEGERKGTRIFSTLDILNKDQEVQCAGQRELSALCHAVGVLAPQELLGTAPQALLGQGPHCGRREHN